MFLIEVIPIARGINKESLSYFSLKAIPEGSLVTVPIRKRVVSALVVSSQDASLSKNEIKSSEFAMRKIGEFRSEQLLSEAFIRAAKAIATHNATTLGAVLNLLVPKIILDLSVAQKSSETPVPIAGLFDKLALQSDNEERFANYRSLIREEFARKRSVYFCVPTAQDAKFFTNELSKGIEDYTFALYGSLSKKKLLETWSKIAEEKHPVLIVATGLFFSLNRNDLGIIVVENESSRSYKFMLRPFLDVRVFAELFAKEIKAKFLVGDTLLRVETIHRIKQGEFSEFAPMKFRSLSSATSKVIDMSAYKKSLKGKFECISLELSELIRETNVGNRHLFILASKRGLASQTVCSDCGTVVVCNLCLSPIALHKTRGGEDNQNFFFCHGCGGKRSAEERCVTCSSWKLTPLGVGLELVLDEIKQKFPHIKIFRIDKDVTPSTKNVQKEVANFYAAPGSILIGTEMALSFLDRKIESAAVASLDSLFSLPDFRIHERVLHLLLKIRSLVDSTFLIQTRMPTEKVIEYAVKGNLIDFYREEIKQREMFRYPPFYTLIKISLAGVRLSVISEMTKLKDYLDPFPLEIFPAFSEDRKGQFTMHALLRLQSGSWVDRSLLKKLLVLPPQFKVVVDPESLL
ncbi:MAG: hypothetical protein EXS46_02420 [Candidatus Taylorbacteria bacterium]|nr:hypothetical protein [Candidatus Taylorbacteria bacterium]